MSITFTGFKAMKEVKSSQSIIAAYDDLETELQTIIDNLTADPKCPSFWSMSVYDPAGKHNKQSVRAITGIILEYEERYAADLAAGLNNIPFAYAVARTERSSGRFYSVFFPLSFEPDTNRSMRVAAVLAHQIGCYGLSRGSGTPTFLVRLEPKQTVAVNEGPVLGEQFIRETADLKEACDALEAFQGPKPVRKTLTVASTASLSSSASTRTVGNPEPNWSSINSQTGECKSGYRAPVTCYSGATSPARKTKNQKIAAQLRSLADLFEADD